MKKVYGICFVVAYFIDATMQVECSITLVLVFRKYCVGILVGTTDILTALFRPFVFISSKLTHSELIRTSLNMTKIS